MNELQNRELSPVVSAVNKMSTKEVADILGVDVKTVQRAALSLDMDVERSGSSHTMLFDEQQSKCTYAKNKSRTPADYSTGNADSGRND